MRYVRTLAASVALIALAAPAPAQTVLDFEDVPNCNNVIGNMGVFGGVDFMMQWTCYDFAQPPFNPSSGTNRLYASSGGGNSSSARFSFAGSTIFGGAFFAGSASVRFDMFFEGALVASSSTLFTTAAPMFLAAGYGNLVDEVEVVGNSVNWVMDDLTFGVASSTVPEPATIMLLVTGFAALGAARRRRRDAAL